jgi:hypothetical protein
MEHRCGVWLRGDMSRLIQKMSLLQDNVDYPEVGCDRDVGTLHFRSRFHNNQLFNCPHSSELPPFYMYRGVCTSSCCPINKIHLESLL